MRLQQITLPYLKSNMTLKDFSKTVGLTPPTVSIIIRKDLRYIYRKLYAIRYYIHRVPTRREDKCKWIDHIDTFISIENSNFKKELENEISLSQVWKSKFAEIFYKIYGGSPDGKYVEICDKENIWDCKLISKKDLLKYFILQKEEK